jgi:hypothetical protein
MSFILLISSVAHSEYHFGSGSVEICRISARAAFVYERLSNINQKEIEK